MKPLRLYYASIIILLTALLIIPEPIIYHGDYLKNRLICRIPIKEKVVSITFDDGPYPKYTEEILDILDKYKVKATFFMIGNRVEQYPNIARKVASRGQLIGNHTFSHPRDIRKLSQSEILNEMKHCQKVIIKDTGEKPLFCRAPSGITNSAVLRAAQEMGFYMINWSIAGDYYKAKTPRQMADHVVQKIEPGSIILLHDGRFPGRWKDVQAAEIIIKRLQAQGYRFVPLSELIIMSEKESSISACRNSWPRLNQRSYGR